MCYCLWYNAPTMLPVGGRQNRGCIIPQAIAKNKSNCCILLDLFHHCNTQSSDPEDGQNNCPKRVKLIGIINKPLLFHLVGCLYNLFSYYLKGKVLNLHSID